MLNTPYSRKRIAVRWLASPRSNVERLARAFEYHVAHDRPYSGDQRY
jgi:hypothetical protein